MICSRSNDTSESANGQQPKRALLSRTHGQEVLDVVGRLEQDDRQRDRHCGAATGGPSESSNSTDQADRCCTHSVPSHPACTRRPAAHRCRGAPLFASNGRPSESATIMPASSRPLLQLTMRRPERAVGEVLDPLPRQPAEAAAADDPRHEEPGGHHDAVGPHRQREVAQEVCHAHGRREDEDLSATISLPS